MGGTVFLRGEYGIRRHSQGPVHRRISSLQNCLFCWAFKVTFAYERSEVPGAMIIVAPACFVESTVKSSRGVRYSAIVSAISRVAFFARQSPGLREEYGIQVKYSSVSSCNPARY